ncbi:MAG: LptF/LptG family permease [Bacteroidaceae bacterium]|nr:LptF/LptG family permease [Bacteroidaceae bacterium]
MRFIRRLDSYVLKQFCLLFAGTFFICLFIFMMQFLWRWVDDLVGKGLSFVVLGKFFFYASMTLIPLSLPLALLLASLITFGNLGERLELLAFKAAGIPLVRIIRPVFIFVALVSGGSFYFQNVIAPESFKQMAALIYSMKQKSPELEIPEAIFYNEIPGYNLFVERKDLETGMLYGILIYTQGSSFDDTQIVLADSGRIQTTAEQMHLKLTLYDGERFRNMQNTGSAMDRGTVPYMRETFKVEVDLIPFDNDFSVMDAGLFSGNAQTKNLNQLTAGIDSLLLRLDSIGQTQYQQYSYGFLNHIHLAGRPDSAALVARADSNSVPFDTLLNRLTDSERSRAAHIAWERSSSGVSQSALMMDYSSGENRALRMHQLERHKKFTLSVACLIFFFIGAPLGAIIRKGGLGVPVVVSVVIFIFYYMVNATGEKMAKSGEWDVTFGLWLSSMVLAPIGAWLTWKANQDSVVFNAEGYQMLFRRIFGLRQHRAIVRKDIIMNEPDYARLLQELPAFASACSEYNEQHHLRRMPNYFRVFFRYEPDEAVIELSNQLEQYVDELANSQDSRTISILNEIPILIPDAHTRPFRRRRLNMAVGLLFPIGIIWWWRIWRYRLRLWHDLTQLQKQCAALIQRIETTT